MSLNQTVDTGNILFAAVLIFFVCALAFLVFYNPKTTRFKIKKKPNGTYSLQYGWDWHNFGDLYTEECETIEQLKTKINQLIEKTEWKPD